MTAWKLVISAALLAGSASAAEPTEVQDPPGEVEVEQPAGVSLPERNTEHDTTDTLRGGGRTDVIDGEGGKGRAAGPDIRAGEAHGDVQPGTEARASFEGGTGSGSPPTDAPTEATGASDATESTFLGTDIGYGTGTDSPSTGPSQ